MAKLTFDDEFNTLGAPWQPVYPWSPNGWATAGSWLPNPSLLPPDGNPISLNNGVLTLSDFIRPPDVSADQVGGLGRIGGQVLTMGAFAQTYGFFEADIQMPAGHGEGGAFWLMPESGAWPPELDIAEVAGTTPTVLATSLVDGDNYSTWHNIPDATTGFHRYGVDWTPTTITWYFDGTPIASTPTPDDMNQPMYMILSLNAGTTGSLEGQAAATTVGQMNVAWVHVYDSNPYTTGGALVGPATPATAPVNDDTIVQIGASTLQAAPAITFIFNGPGHDTTITGFDVHSNVLDFEMTSKDFSAIDVSNATDGWASIDFDGNHIHLPGVTMADLTWDNFHILGQWNQNPV